MTILVDKSRSIGDFHVHPRVILISNGRATDLTDVDTNCSPMTGTSEVSAIILLLKRNI